MVRGTFLTGLVGLLLVAAPVAAQDKVVVVGIDTKTEQELGPFGGSYRTHHSTLIRNLNAAGVKGIAFDVYFPSNPSQQDATNRLAAAAAHSASRGIPVVIAVGSEPNAGGVLEQIPNDPVFDGKDVGQAAIFAGRELTGLLVNGEVEMDVRKPDGSVKGVQEIMMEFMQSNPGKPITSVEPLSGMAIVTRDSNYRPLSEELALRTGVLKTPTHAEQLGLVEKVLTGFDGVPVYTDAIRPGFATSKVTTVSYVDVINKTVDRELLEGALVFVGMTNGTLDMLPSPDPEGSPDLATIPGVYTHAAALNRIAAAAKAEADGTPTATTVTASSTREAVTVTGGMIRRAFGE